MSFTGRALPDFPLAVVAGIAIVAFGLFSSLFAVAGATVLTGSYNSCTITEKDQVPSTKGGSNTYIHASGCNGSSETKVFSVANHLYIGHVKSDDTYDSLEVGTVYDFETRGFYVPVLNSHESIIGITAK